MTRRGTVIRHTILTSESIAQMTHEQILVWNAFLLCCDDWGRLPDKPSTISMKCPAFHLDPAFIKEAIEYFIEQELIARYTTRLPDGDRMVTVLQLCTWEIHQKRLTSRDYPEYPDVNGNLEMTTNPLAISKLEVKEKEKEKIKEKEKVRPVTGRLPHDIPDGRYLEAVKKLFPNVPINSITPQAKVLETIERIDGCTLEQLMPALEWAVADKRDGFNWSSTFLSCSPLRNRKEAGGAMKWQKIKAAYERDFKVSKPKRDISDPSTYSPEGTVDLTKYR